MFSWLGDLLDEYLGLVVLTVLVALVTLIIVSARDEETKRETACARAMALAQSASDSITVILRCEVQQEDGTTVVPIPMYMPR